MTILSDREITAYSNLLDIASRRGNEDLWGSCYRSFILRLSRKGYWRKVYEEIAKQPPTAPSPIPMRRFELP